MLPPFPPIIFCKYLRDKRVELPKPLLVSQITLLLNHYKKRCIFDCLPFLSPYCFPLPFPLSLFIPVEPEDVKVEEPEDVEVEEPEEEVELLEPPPVVVLVVPEAAPEVVDPKSVEGEGL